MNESNLRDDIIKLIKEGKTKEDICNILNITLLEFNNCLSNHTNQ
jgi:DNA-binding CsgD family transcriptional regulator